MDDPKRRETIRKIQNKKKLNEQKAKVKMIQISNGILYVIY